MKPYWNGQLVWTPDSKTLFVREEGREDVRPDGGLEVLGGQKIKSPGNFTNCRENRYKFLPPSEDGEREGRTGWRGQGGGKGEGGRQGRRGPSEAG